jgi:hypothetical protein
MAVKVVFEEKLREIINQFSIEAESNTPDFILAQYMEGCLNAFNAAVKRRDGWYNFKPFDNFPASVNTIKLG